MLIDWQEGGHNWAFGTEIRNFTTLIPLFPQPGLKGMLTSNDQIT